MALHEDKMGMARLYTVKKAPYSSTIVHGFIYVPMPGIRTMLCTETMVLGYDPEWAERATVEELAADIYHEVNHFMRRHFARKNVARGDLFNKAGDLAINPDLRNAGWKLSTDPKMGALFPKEHFGFPEGLSTEEYYDLLLKKEQQDKEKQEKQGGPSGGSVALSLGAPGTDKGKPGDGGGKGGHDKEKKPGDGEGEGDGDGDGENSDGQSHGHCAGGSCGSIAGGLRAEWERLLETHPEVQPRTEVEMHAIELRAAQEIKAWQAKQAAGRGNTPGWMQEFIKAVEEEPVVAWEDELATITYDCVGMMQAGGDDYSFKRPSKRSYVRGFPRPGLVEYLPEIAIILDTSGSMGLQQLLAVAREIIGIMEALGIDEIWFCEADASVSQNWQRVHLDYFKELVIKGRGGTDFRPALASVRELHPHPDLVFYGTDGDGPAPAEPPADTEVVWLIVPGHWNRAPAAWGHIIFATDDKEEKRRFEKQHAKLLEENAWDDD